MYKIIVFFLYIVPILGSELKNVTIILPWKHQFQFAGYYAAKELGLYKKSGLNVTIKEYDLKRDISEDISKQRYTFGVGHSYLVLDKINKFDNLRFLAAIHQSSPIVLLTTSYQNIKTISDIKNKKIMMSPEQKYTTSITAMLYSQNLTYNDFTIVNTDFQPLDLINATANLMVAFSSNEPYVLKTKGIKYNIFDPKDYGYNFYSDILFTSLEVIQKDPQLVQKFYDASMQGWEYAYHHIDETVELILQKYNTQNRTKQALLFEANTLKQLAYTKDTPLGSIKVDRIKEIANTYRLLNLTVNKITPKFDTFIYQISSQNNTNFTTIKKEKSSLIDIFQKYQYSIYTFIFLLLITTFMALYFRYKLHKKLKEKISELDESYKIFDKNISAIKTDLDGHITSVSEAFCETSGYREEEVLGKNPKIFQAKDSGDAAFYKNLWLTITSGHTWRGEFKNTNKDGSEYWSEAIISPILDKRKNIIGYENIRKDITLKKVLEEFNHKLEREVQERTYELTLLAITDKLTSLYNRVHIDKELIKNVHNFQRYNVEFSIILIDIDYFKKVNDTYGHLVGDDVLITLSNILKESVRNTDILGRWGGEEFMVLCPSTKEEGAFSLAQSISKNIASHKFNIPQNVTISCGVAQINTSLNEISLINKADQALYKAKDLGRNRVQR